MAKLPSRKDISEIVTTGFEDRMMRKCESHRDPGQNRRVNVLCHSVMLTLCEPMDYIPPGFLVHGASPGKNTGVGCYVLLRGVFPSQGLNPGLPRCRQILSSQRGQQYAR